MKTKSGKNFYSVNSILSKQSNPKLKQAFNRHRAISVWQQAASSLFSEQAMHTQAMDFKNGVLVVACLSRELAYQIKLFAQRLIEELNKLIGQKIVFAIHTLI